MTEREVLAAARSAHGDAAEKFVHEVFWRGYFKGYLETRPWIWTHYTTQLAAAQAQLAANGGLRAAYDQAVQGRTGIDCFDDWARELVAENWLHNHARMWFASIWIFTLRLPWVLGADFFLRHLLDGDPACNTLSWRWVGGLHTRGKHYVARADNIRRYTDGRYSATGLDETPAPLEEPEEQPALPLPPAPRPPASDVALLLHVEDLNPETLDLGPAKVVRVCGLPAHVPGAAAAVRAADRQALEDGLARAAAHFGCPIGEVSADLKLVTAWAPVGPTADALPPAVRVLRSWDAAVWARSTKGYFKLKEAIPGILEKEGLLF